MGLHSVSPARQRLDMCFQMEQTCDGGLPVGRLFMPIVKRGLVPSHDPKHNDAVFTEDFVKAQHGELYMALTLCYETLRCMKCIEESEIRRPPHQTLPKEELVTIGLEPEVIALLRHLPFREMMMRYHMATLPYNYLNDVSEAREVLWKDEYKSCTMGCPPWFLESPPGILDEP
ncbi:uncharacterized protein EAF02_000380 [Botrytis sinoallii]|uniref:uncharacterized protein n=1 Tax=Botrytis sinoallii TaxID=1463999 RepID=UPI0018FFB425|nr:uncharacterized protein EAF02_000380 [Botrytis sinoallii]KAF7892842.1 hypothetical protein EAF02_000380 [Botrytis sinoallii]